MHAHKNLLADADPESILALEAIRKGKVYISPLLWEQLPGLLAKHYRRRGSQAEILTEREKQILKLIAAGKPSKEIGAQLFISARTVQNHRANLMRKLNLKKTADLVKYAIQQGLS
jgi:DNA-binding NarL/FixJ family response regulator